MSETLEIVRISALDDNYIWLVGDRMTRDAVVIDPAVAAPVLAEAAARGWTIREIWNTHWHPDHIGGDAEIQGMTGARIVAPGLEDARIPNIGLKVREGSRLQLGSHTATVWEVPGHTLGHVAFHFETAGVIFSGDTLFAMGCGRLFEGTPAQMWANMERFAALADATKVYCAHEYTLANARFAASVEPDNIMIRDRLQLTEWMREAGEATVPTTVGLERRTNPFMRAGSAESLRERRAAKESFA